MPRGPVPEWRRRKEPVLDDFIMASINQAGGLGRHHPETGHYATLHITGISTQEEAAEYVKALYRCAHHLNRHGIAPVSMSAKVRRAVDGGFFVEFRAIDKTLARAYVLQRYGSDRSRWPYDPRARAAASM